MNKKRDRKLFDVKLFAENFKRLAWGEDYIKRVSLNKKYTSGEVSDLIKKKTKKASKDGKGIVYSESSINNYLSGHQTPSADAIVCIATAFDVSTDYLLGLSEIENPDEVDKKMNEKYSLSSTAMANLAKWKKGEHAPRYGVREGYDEKINDIFMPFSEFKILQAIMEDDTILAKIERRLVDRFNAFYKLNDNRISKQQYEDIVDSKRYSIARDFEIFTDTLFNVLEKRQSERLYKIFSELENISSETEDPF